MASYTETSVDDSFNSQVRDSDNTTSTASSTTWAVDLDQVGNTDSSTNDSNNLTVGLDGVGNVDSHDTSTEASGSFNDWSDNSVEDDSDSSWTDNSDRSTTDTSDSSVNGSYNDASTSVVEGSYNTYLDESVDDHSVDVGTRDYSTGIGDIGLGGGGGGGDVWVNNQNTIVDQSVNATGGGWGGSDAVVASGDGSVAAGNDVHLSQSVDHSTTFSAQGDVNIGNETQVVTITDSYNETTDSSSWTDSSTHLDVDDSFNADTASWTATNSYNEELTSQTDDTWNIDADVIWGSDDAVIADTATVDDGFDAS